MNCIYLDIETAPLDRKKLDLIMPHFVATRAKKPEKVEEEIKEKQDRFIDNAALNWWTCRILAIGLRYQVGGEMVNEILADDDEAANLNTFFSKWEPRGTWGFGQGDKIVGFNVQGFDLVMLINRARVHGVKVPYDFHDLRYAGYQRWIIDIQTQLECGLWTRDHCSLNSAAIAFGCGSKHRMNSAFFSELWEKDRQTALAHLKNDLIITEAVHKRIEMCKGD